MGYLSTLADAGVVFVWVVWFYIRLLRSSGRQRRLWYRWYVSGVSMGWGGYLIRWWAFSEQSAVIANTGAGIELVGVLCVICALIVLFRIPKIDR